MSAALKERVKVSFYEVEQAGYYKWGGKTSEFCPFPVVLQELDSWCAGKTVEQTALANNGGDGNTLPVYLLDVQERAGHYLITAWNQTFVQGNNTASVKRTSHVGSASSSMTQAPKDSIPGFATYFWFIPSKGVFATLVFESDYNGQKNLQTYIESFLGHCTSFVRFDPNDPQKIVGYSKSPGTPKERVYPKFRAKPYIKEGLHQEIISRATEIRKVMRKTVLNLSQTDDSSFWQRLVRRTHLSSASSAQALTMPIEYEVPTKVTATEVRAMIRDWKTKPLSRLEDYGFEFKASNKQLWLSHAWAKDTIQVTVPRSSAAVINGKELLRALNMQSTSLLSLL